MFNAILLASDGSNHALRATDKAILLAKHNPDAVITIVYIVDSSKSKSDVLHHSNPIEIDQRRKEKLLLTEQKIKKASIAYEVKILHGEPGPAIVKYANGNNIDICVIGSRGLNSLQEMVLGSVSHKVAKRANCPVMIVK
ncbi:universal stress protein [Aquibacillus sp. 3ASR75-11]|uniref:Universal stress protein n=1 Tax=Terrihalobacillus insolitus TaxID=2950438 RepID=A0A9X3WT72_9BACI|nr:universal stress protein [Terrihalobacillus insolitus]MDC3412323.1 universal stress protein [Terrihalobacillus insolitus]MDC3422984.1 universal stress protein [Terrihalobacillus insolitus]